MRPLDVGMRIRTSDINDWSADPVFTKWYPEGLEDALEIERDGQLYLIYFDRSCIPSLSMRDRDFSEWWTIEPSSVLVHTVVEGLSDDQLAHLHWTLDRAEELDEGLRAEAEALVTKLIRGAVAATNRMLSWMRSHKGQFWLVPVWDGSPSTLVRHFNVQGRVGTGEWFRIDPYKAQIVDAAGRSGFRGITDEDWLDLREWARSDRGTDLVGELLANAEQLEESDHRRAAVVEVVSALEVALSRFSAPDGGLDGAAVGRDKRLSGVTLAKHVERLGLRATVAYLLPLLMDQERLPEDLHASVLAAIDRRNEVVHLGRRDVPQDEVRTLLRSVHSLCDLLAEARSP